MAPAAEQSGVCQSGWRWCIRRTGASTAELDASAELVARVRLTEVDLSIILGLNWHCLGLSTGVEAPLSRRKLCLYERLRS